jgi:hypothetical protein
VLVPAVLLRSCDQIEVLARAEFPPSQCRHWGSSRLRLHDLDLTNTGAVAQP